MIKHLIFLLCISTSLSAQVMLPAYQGVQGAAISSAITTPVVPVTGAGGRIWMDRNLGATQVATSSTNTVSYGDLYQWGRRADGHQLRGSGTTTSLSSNDVTGNDEFVLSDVAPYDWRNPQNANLWQGVNGVNNPCPSGYRLPTKDEWDDEIQNWNSPDAAGALASPLKLPMAGSRSSSFGSGGAIATADTYGFYWSSTVGGTGGSGTYANYLVFASNLAITTSFGLRSSGYSVRCIKD
jgi:uncharacterized protein (TIGR02145 family)